MENCDNKNSNIEPNRDGTNIPIMSKSQVHQPCNIHRLSAAAPYSTKEEIECIENKGVPENLAPILAMQAKNDCDLAAELYNSGAKSSFLTSASSWWPHGDMKVQEGDFVQKGGLYKKSKRKSRKRKSRKRKSRKRRLRKKSKKKKFTR